MGDDRGARAQPPRLPLDRAAAPRRARLVRRLDDGRRRRWRRRSNYQIDIFEPDYVGQGGRPTITSCPANISYDTPFRVDTPQANSIARVALIRCGSITHGFNSDQRYVGLAFTVHDGNTLSVSPPPSGDIAPPGYYMLWLIDEQGRPCQRASFIRVSKQKLFVSADISTFSVFEVDALGPPSEFADALYVACDGFLPSEVTTPDWQLLRPDNSPVPGMSATFGPPKYEAGSDQGDVAQRIVYPVQHHVRQHPGVRRDPRGPGLPGDRLLRDDGPVHRLHAAPAQQEPQPPHERRRPTVAQHRPARLQDQPRRQPDRADRASRGGGRGRVRVHPGRPRRLQRRRLASRESPLRRPAGRSGDEPARAGHERRQRRSRLQLRRRARAVRRSRGGRRGQRARLLPDVDDGLDGARVRASAAATGAPATVPRRLRCSGCTAARSTTCPASPSPARATWSSRATRRTAVRSRAPTPPRSTATSAAGSTSTRMSPRFPLEPDGERAVHRRRRPRGSDAASRSSCAACTSASSPRSTTSSIRSSRARRPARATTWPSATSSSTSPTTPATFAAHLVHHTFELEPSPTPLPQTTPVAGRPTPSAAAGRLHPDELAIDWGELPRESLVTFYMPQVDADDDRPSRRGAPGAREPEGGRPRHGLLQGERRRLHADPGPVAERRSPDS